MAIVFLTSLPLNYADLFKFEHSGKSASAIIVNQEQKLLIKLNGITNFSTSGDNTSISDYLDFIDIQHEYRPVNSTDLQKFGLFSSAIHHDNSMHIISIYGDVIFHIICKIVDIQSTEVGVNNS